MTFDAGNGTFSYYDDAKGQTVKDVSKASIKTRVDGELSNKPYDVISKDTNKLFDAWYDAKGNRYESLYDHKFTSDITLTAKYVSLYTITFKAGAGTFRYYDESLKKYVDGGTRASYKTDKDGTVSRYPDNPVASDAGKAFDYWYVDGKKVESIWNYVFTSNKTVEAHYVGAYAITLDANGGYFGSKDVKTSKVSVVQENSINISTTPSREGNYIFGGWFFDQKCTNAVPTYYVPQKNVTVYAKWLETAMVTFNMGDGKLSGSTEKAYTVIKGTPFGARKTKYNESILPDNPVPNSSDKAFVGWFKTGACADADRIEKTDILSYVVNGDVTFYAGYKSSYTVTFDANGGSFISGYSSTKTVKVAEGESLKGKYPSVKSTEEKVFCGWFTDYACKNAIADIYSYVPKGDVTLYAGYTECFVLTFDVNQDDAGFRNISDSIVKIKINKGEAYRYGTEYASEDILFEAPEVEYEEINGKLPLTTNQGYGDNFWSVNKDGSGLQYVFGSSEHYYIDEKRESTTITICTDLFLQRA